jgi:choline dehydrogenase-like flavoprotein
VGVSGEKLGLAHLPDGEFLPPFELNCLDKDFKNKIESKYKGRNITITRVAHLTEPQPWHLELGRGQCQTRNRCSRGCPYGAYYSSNAAALPAANLTGNFSIRPNSIVHSLIYDEQSGKAKGVRVIDSETMESVEYFAKIIFMCASAPATAQILLHSTSNRFPNGFGNDSGEVGHNIMDHHYHVGAMGTFDGFEDQYYAGRRPTGIFIPKYVNIDKSNKNDSFLRGDDYQGASGRESWGRGNGIASAGAEFKDSLMKPGPWTMSLMGFGEVLPNHDNKMTLSPDKVDKWGIPQIVFDASHGENESAGFKDVKSFDNIGGLGNGVHEMGTARMGKDPKTSVVNKWNQMHSVDNVFITDGSFMTSSNCVNPSITYMAFTARAVDYAVNELNKKNL